MENNAAVVAYEENVATVVDMVFRTMLNLAVVPYPATWKHPKELITAIVYFAGEWDGAILLECTRDQALKFTQRLMGIDLPETIDDDVRDALGELANMLAGNLKSVLPPGVVLSMPSVIEGRRYSLRFIGKGDPVCVPFSSSEDIFGVTLVV